MIFDKAYNELSQIQMKLNVILEELLFRRTFKREVTIKLFLSYINMLTDLELYKCPL